MNHWWRFVALFAFVSLSLLTYITPVEAFGRCRHRCQCQPVCSPCAYPQPQFAAQVYGGYAVAERSSAVAQQCMYCDGTYWQVATDGQPCTMMASSMAGSLCNQEEKRKAKAPNIKTIHGRNLIKDPFLNLNFWYSDKDGMNYDGTSLWCCQDGALLGILPAGGSTNGAYYDITVYVDGTTSPKPEQKHPPVRTIYGRSFQLDPYLQSYVWYSDEYGKLPGGANLWSCPQQALKDAKWGTSPTGEPCWVITVYVDGRPLQ